MPECDLPYPFPRTKRGPACSPLLAALALSIGLGEACAQALDNAEEPARSSPNIVLVLVDDLGWRDVGFLGSEYYETPHIDALAARGIGFTNAYANAPNCAPSRASLLSGQVTPRHGIYTVGSSSRGPSAERRLVPTPNKTALEESIVTLAEALGAAGYTCASIGKWHLGEDPRSQGFDVNIGGDSRGHPKRYFSPFGNANLSDGPEGEYLTDRLTDEALGFMRAHAADPFFLYLPHFAVHTPIQGQPELVEKYKARGIRDAQGKPAYAAMVESVDNSVGRIVSELETLGLERDTVVVLFSDNGGHAGFTSMAPLRGSKGMLYEGGIRVPLVLSWPGHISPGRRMRVPVCGTDLYPTLVELAGAETPAGQACDGLSLAPLALRDERLPERSLFWHFPAYLEGATAAQGTWRTTPVGAIRRGDHKLLEFFEDSRVELYDLSVDPGESMDLAAMEPDLVQEMLLELGDWRRSVGAPVPVEPNPEYAGER